MIDLEGGYSALYFFTKFTANLHITNISIKTIDLLNLPLYNIVRIYRKDKFTMYKVIETKIISEGKEERVYGLQHADGTVMKNVSGNKAEAERLAEMFSEMKLAPYQLNDVLEDMVDTTNGFGE